MHSLLASSQLASSSDPVLSNEASHITMAADFLLPDVGPPSPPWDADAIGVADHGHGHDADDRDLMDFLPDLSAEDLQTSASPGEDNSLIDCDKLTQDVMTLLNDVVADSEVAAAASNAANAADPDADASANQRHLSSASPLSPLASTHSDDLDDDEMSSSSSASASASSAELSFSNSPLRKDIVLSFASNNVISFQQNQRIKPESAEVDVAHCSVCKLVFSSPSALSVHRNTYSGRLTCCHCEKTFSSQSKLVSHHRKHSKEKPFECKSCGKFYTHRTTLARHQLHYCTTIRAKCEDGGAATLLPVSAQPAQPAQNGPPILARPIQNGLGIVTVAAALPARNPATEMLSVVVTPDMPMTTMAMSTTKTTTTTKPANLTGGVHLDVSKNKSKNNKPDTCCRVCSKEFFDALSLKHHTDYHLNLRSCCLCLRVLGNKSKLLTHHRSHTKESPYSCNECGKRFSENSTLRKHEATHGARKYECNECGKSFVRKDYLAKHVLTHRQTFKCSQCAYVCHTRNAIEFHVAVHKCDSVGGTSAGGASANNTSESPSFSGSKDEDAVLFDLVM